MEGTIRGAAGRKQNIAIGQHRRRGTDGFQTARDRRPGGPGVRRGIVQRRVAVRAAELKNFAVGKQRGGADGPARGQQVRQARGKRVRAGKAPAHRRRIEDLDLSDVVPCVNRHDVAIGKLRPILICGFVEVGFRQCGRRRVGVGDRIVKGGVRQPGVGGRIVNECRAIGSPRQQVAIRQHRRRGVAKIPLSRVGRHGGPDVRDRVVDFTRDRFGIVVIQSRVDSAQDHDVAVGQNLRVVVEPQLAHARHSGPRSIHVAAGSAGSELYRSIQHAAVREQFHRPIVIWRVVGRERIRQPRPSAGGCAEHHARFERFKTGLKSAGALLAGRTAGDCPDFAQSAEQNGTVHLSAAVL